MDPLDGGRPSPRRAGQAADRPVRRVRGRHRPDEPRPALLLRGLSPDLKLIHYGRSVEADGRIEGDPTIAEALQMRIAQILGDGYHERKRQVPPALRNQIFERDDGRCVLCGAPATEIDHISGDANTLENLRAACGECNLGMAQRHLVPAQPDKSALADELLERIFASTPVFPRDDQTAWTTLNVGLIAERRGRLQAHIAVRKLRARAATVGGLRPA